MDAFNLDYLKIEKANAMLRYRHLHNVVKLFRIFEFCLALVFLSWISSRLPFILKISGDYCRLLFQVIVSPIFIFLLSNVIVLTLLAKSGLLTAQSSVKTKSDTDLFEELADNIKNSIDFELDSGSPPPQLKEEEEIVYHDKQIVGEVNITEDSGPNNYKSEVTLVPDHFVPDNKNYRRSQSENLERDNSEKPCAKLRRSETEICRKIESSKETSTETVELVDKLSNEEFQRTIEAFIAKQVRFHKEEKSTIVLHI